MPHDWLRPLPKFSGLLVQSVDYGMARPSEEMEYDDPSLKEEEPIHDDFNFGHRYREK